MRFLAGLALASILFLPHRALAENPAAASAPKIGFAQQRAAVLALGKLTEPPQVHAAEGFDSTLNLRAIYYDALPWKGKPTRVFAWLGVPESKQAKLPGIVLVHGGGGTAFKDWVEKWNAHGFAAISIAVEGQTDEPAPSPTPRQRAWKSHAWAGPKRPGIYTDFSEPLAEQWMYHAVADTILANSLLRSLPEVDAERVGIMGVSWGGVITSTVMGIDSRFAFAVPTYGCGHLFDADNQWGRALGDNAQYQNVWDPMLRMDRANMPALWLSWPGDTHFPLDCQAATYRAAAGPRMVALIPGMGHSQKHATTPADSYAFAESVFRDGKPWCRQTAAFVRDGTAEVEFVSWKPLEQAVLLWTPDRGFTADRKWNESPATMEQRDGRWRITASLPEEATAWFVNARSGELTVSSDFQEVK